VKTLDDLMHAVWMGRVVIVFIVFAGKIVTIMSRHPAPSLAVDGVLFAETH
jgi:hypothetical protein